MQNCLIMYDNLVDRLRNANELALRPSTQAGRVYYRKSLLGKQKRETSLCWWKGEAIEPTKSDPITLVVNGKSMSFVR